MLRHFETFGGAFKEGVNTLPRLLLRGQQKHYLDPRLATERTHF